MNTNKLAQRYGIRVDFLEETTSTNDAARNGGYGHGDIVAAESQTAGRGQRGNRWESAPGENLTFSLVLRPAFLPADRQFLLSETISLALADMLEGYRIHARIKWPNDIYAGPRIEGMPPAGDLSLGKIAGILIENDIQGGRLARSIVGIGLNVNQHVFSPYVPNPVSMLVSGQEYEPEEVLERLYDAFVARYRMLEGGQVEKIQDDYHRRLYLLGATHDFRFQDGGVLRGTIRRVEPAGELIVEENGGGVKSFLFKEILF